MWRKVRIVLDVMSMMCGLTSFLLFFFHRHCFSAVFLHVCINSHSIGVWCRLAAIQMCENWFKYVIWKHRAREEREIEKESEIPLTSKPRYRQNSLNVAPQLLIKCCSPPFCMFPFCAHDKFGLDEEFQAINLCRKRARLGFFHIQDVNVFENKDSVFSNT